MRLHILSDLHLEFEGYTPDRTKADVVILAGDIDTGSEGIKWAKKCFPRQPVIYVMGNHEFYGHSMQTLMSECRAETQGTNIHLLENQSVQLGGLTFLGCTLWTDFGLWPKPNEAMGAALDYMSDYKLIQTSAGRLQPINTVKLHQASLAWLRAQLKLSAREKTVIITHHAPSGKSIPPRFAGDILNGAFASDLKAFLKQCRVPLWIHGHTHHCVDYRIGATRIYSNQRGYPGEREAGFDTKAIINL
jgi:predicted phosphodiesterase